MIDVICPTESDTRALARKLAPTLRPGDVVVLSGSLGAGKTLFTAGLAEGLGVDEPVMSPTFVLARSYHSGFMPLVHVDVYRLGSINEFDDLDVFEQARDGVLVIEWGDAIDVLLPDEHLQVSFEVGEDSSRRIVLTGTPGWETRNLEEIL